MISLQGIYQYIYTCMYVYLYLHMYICVNKCELVYKYHDNYSRLDFWGGGYGDDLITRHVSIHIYMYVCIFIFTYVYMCKEV
jgi:hypothetical protein